MKKTIALLTATLVLSGLVPAGAQTEASRSGTVEWIVPPAAHVAPQTDDEKKRGMTDGRDLPAREVLQPTLDPGLAPYVPRPTASLHGHFKAAASDVLPGLAKSWAAAFHAYYPGVTIEIDPPYAGSLGAVELAKGNLDAVFVSRELRPDDVTAFRGTYGYDPLSIPISGGSYRHFGFLDAVAFIVNPANPVQHLSFEQLDAAFSKTRWRGGAAAVTWGDLGVGGAWAAKPVRLYGVKPWNGFEEFVRQRILSTPGKRGEWRDGIAYSGTVFPLAGAVANDPAALAYDGLAYLDAPVKVVPIGPVGGPYVAPTYENVTTADYALSRLIYLNLNKVPGKPLDPALAEFVRFVLSRQGQALVQQQNVFVPLRAAQTASSLALLGS